MHKLKTNKKRNTVKVFLSFGTETLDEAEVKSTVWVSSGAAWLLTAESGEQVELEHFLLHQSF